MTLIFERENEDLELSASFPHTYKLKAVSVSRLMADRTAILLREL